MILIFSVCFFRSLTSSTDQVKICDVYFKFCDRLLNTSVEYRNAHEYGEVPLTMPTVPTAPKSGRPSSSRQREKFANPRDLFENALKSANTNSSAEVKTVTVQKVEAKTEYSNPKDLFENALKSAGKQPADVTNNSLLAGNVFESQYNGNNVQNAKGLFDQALQAATGPKLETAVNGRVNSTQRK